MIKMPGELPRHHDTEGRNAMNGYPKRASRPSKSQDRTPVVLDLPTVRKMLPLVRHIIGDILDAEQQMGTLLWEQDGLERNRRTLNWPERQRRYFLQDEVSRVEQQRKHAIGELKQLGVQVLDVAHGRVGFPTIVNTKPAYFSWQAGEEEVGFWHFTDDERRRPIPVSWTKEAPMASLRRK
jgi:hypothetical protein